MTQVPIAIVGVSALFPGSTDAQGFWRDILLGRDLITDVPPSHWLIEDYYDPDPSAPDKTYSRRGAFLPDVAFDPMEFGIPPSILPATDTAQLLALIVAQRVLDDATQGQFARMDRERASVILGVTSGQELLGTMVSRLQRPIWLKALRDSGVPEDEATVICDRIASGFVPWQESSFPGLLGNVVAGRIANRFDLRGTNCVTDAACASTLSALSMAVNELAIGQSDLVIAGGVDTMNDIFMYMCFSKTPALSKTGDCRPFSDAADGTLLGEGMAMLALKRLDDAERAGDRVYAVIRGVGSASDGRSKSVYAPLPEGQARALRRAYQSAGYGAETVELVEAHGTATKAGDAAEFAGLEIAFGETGRVDRQWCALGSVKSQIGHTKSAAGAAGLFKAVMALHHKVLPPTIKVDRPNPALAIEKSPFYLNTQSRPWIRDASHPRRASVSSFGFGGSNFHVALEEYVGPGAHAWRLRTAPTELVLLSDATSAGLAAKCDAMAAHAREAGLSVVARASQEAFRATDKARLAVVASDTADLAAKLAQAQAHLAAKPDAALATPSGVHYAVGDAVGPVAFVFPGQGSQYVGMGGDVAMSEDAARSVWDDAAGARFDDATVGDVVFPRPVFTDDDRAAQTKRLTATEWAQPAIGVASLALLRVLRAVGVKAEHVGGHSFGEITALCAAGVIDEAALVAVARHRGELMRDASATPGAMTAVGRSIGDVRAVLAEFGDAVVVANHNHPKQVVLSGAEEAITRVEALLAAKGMPARRLPVSTAFHSALVAPSGAKFGEFLAGVTFAAPGAVVWSNAEAAPYPTDADGMRARLAGQIARPVRFVEQVEAMWARGARTFVEVGPGAVLTDLVGRILGDRAHVCVPLDRKGKHGVTSLQEALGRLAVAGVALDFAPLWDAYARPSTTPKKKPAMTLSLNGSNYGKPYPPAGGAAARPKPNPPRVPEVVVKEVLVEVIKEVVVVRDAAPTMATTTMAQATSGAEGLAWVQAYQESQRQTSEAHAAYLQTMADTHSAFLRTVETSFSGLSAMLAGQPMAAVAVAPVAVAAAPAARVAPVVVVAPVVALVAAAPVAAPVAVAKAAPAVDLQALMLAIVAEKTGYPAEMLALTMELEADLGIDSIKRVEILSAMRERAPGLPEVNATEMAALRTLGQIVDYMQARLPAAAAPVVVAVAKAAPAVDLEALMLAIVAEKTGYPAEMLALTMELEADLGIDSIKRVEILSAMRERAPGLPEVNATEMAALRTLGQIVDYMRGRNGVAPATAAKAAPAAVPTASVIQRFVLEEEAAPAAGLVVPGLFGAAHVAVTDDGAGVAQCLVDALHARGVTASVVATVPADADAVIFLGGLRAVASVDEAVAVNREAFAVARAVAARFASKGGLFVTVQDTGGDFGLSGHDATRAWTAGVSALARTAAVEWTGASVKAIDLARAGRSPAALAAALAAELFTGGATREVGLHADGARTTLRSVAREVVAGPLAVDASAVVVVSGGGRGVTAASIVALAQRSRPRIVLLGRSRLEDEPVCCRGVVDDAGLKRALLDDAKRVGWVVSPADVGAQVARVLANREVRGTLAAIGAAGSEVRYVAVDVADAAKLGVALDEVRGAWGPITGVVHGAGVLADKLIAEKTAEQFDRVFDTKVTGLRALLAATAGDPLRWMVLFSSVAARTGNTGQCDYAMANEVLNKVAAAERHARGAGFVAKSIGWGPWEGGMVTPALKARFDQMGVALIPLAEGARRFVDEITAAPPEVETVVGSALGDGPLGAKTTAAAMAVEVAVDHRSHPYLTDHRVAGKPVLPVALAIEWMARAARVFRPGAGTVVLRDLKVLRGIKMDHFESVGHRFALHGAARAHGGPDDLAIELRGKDNALHFSATLDTAGGVRRAPERAADPKLGPWTREAVYDGHLLFHGPSFQVIQSVAGVSREGMVGTLTGVRERGWADEAWRTDVAALDGALQFALLWSREVLGGASLPMAVASFESFSEALPEGMLRCVVRGREVHDARAVCDVLLEDLAGHPLALFRGVETILRPGETVVRADVTAGVAS